MPEESAYPTINVDLLRQVVAHIKVLVTAQTQPEYSGDVWDQNQWRTGAFYSLQAAKLDIRQDRCGTAMCVAGWAIELDAKNRKVNPLDIWVTGPDDAYAFSVWATPEEIRRADGVYHLSGTDQRMVVNAGSRAADLLGLTPYEADTLFNGIDTEIDELEKLVEEIIEGVYR